MPDYDKVGLLTVRDGKILLCRNKSQTSLLILPGGCREAGEASMDCLHRELREELGDVQLGPVTFLGEYSDFAAGSGGAKTVRIELYGGDLTGEPAPCSEIAQLVWFGEDSDWARLAPSIRNKIFPDLIRRGILAWRRHFSTETAAR
ncbi:MAG TPA: NUDIX domain-containing protein [Bryobacteraceae bacterium]|nr:NUDIX domain-containing protein [Bryobacteraceae bacterium]